MLKQALAVLVFAAVAVPSSLAARDKRDTSVCQYGKGYIDKCENQCICLENGQYACTRRGCQNPSDSEVPKSCDSNYKTNVVHNNRLLCKAGIVQFVSDSEPEKCDPGTSWKDDCNTCTCSVRGDFAACTLKACIPAGQIIFDSANTRIPTDDGVELEFGDITVNFYVPCPNGLVEGPLRGQNKICHAKGCSAGAKWTLDDGCTKCTCLKNGEPACGECLRKPTDTAHNCNGSPRCPADCSRDFFPKKNCYECCTGIGNIGDAIPIHSDCPRGTDVSSYGFVQKWCAPYHLLPKGDTRICETGLNTCPQDCKLVRVAPNEGCVYCQCQAPKKPTPCKYGEEKMVDCNTCVCLDSGYMACTRRDCKKNYDQVSCGVDMCPADCPKLVDKRDNCVFCSCNPNGEVTVPKDDGCPEGQVPVREGFSTLICVNAPTPPPLD